MPFFLRKSAISLSYCAVVSELSVVQSMYEADKVVAADRGKESRYPICLWLIFSLCLEALAPVSFTSYRSSTALWLRVGPVAALTCEGNSISYLRILAGLLSAGYA